MGKNNGQINILPLPVRCREYGAGRGVSGTDVDFIFPPATPDLLGVAVLRCRGEGVGAALDEDDLSMMYIFLSPQNFVLK